MRARVAVLVAKFEYDCIFEAHTIYLNRLDHDARFLAVVSQFYYLIKYKFIV